MSKRGRLSDYIEGERRKAAAKVAPEPPLTDAVLVSIVASMEAHVQNTATQKENKWTWRLFAEIPGEICSCPDVAGWQDLFRWAEVNSDSADKQKLMPGYARIRHAVETAWNTANPDMRSYWTPLGFFVVTYQPSSSDILVPKQRNNDVRAL